ncbi:protein NO VEIN domain-containing protein [Pseudonocardia sp. TMWB2A]|uniref:protein NO VEIN domain-containing protein n=1 Tax=Pseudonocardia sp. TMWB2A TaxID=687430 RepID=UPI00307F39CC
MQKIIYFNIGWMKFYNGPAADDPTLGAHGYLADKKHGHEASNFKKTSDNKAQGYRPPGTDDAVNIKRLGAKPSDEKIDNVLVVWIARHPKSNVTQIVGWYRNATVYRHCRQGEFTINGSRVYHAATCAYKDAYCIPEDARSFQIMSSRQKPGAGFGQKPTWYGAPAVDKKVIRYIDNYDARMANAKKNKSGSGKSPRNMDPEARKIIEEKAVKSAAAHFKAIYPRCKIVSVERDAVGWDLEVLINRKVQWKVEVKGLSGPFGICELTPNEYTQMRHADHRAQYVIFVASNLAAPPPAVPVNTVFYPADKGEWHTEDGAILTIREATAARLSYKR